MISSDRYQQFKKVYEQAVDLKSPEREAFLREVCAEDEELRLEVESLIEADRKAGSFISTTALDSLAKDLAQERQESFQGRKLGRYQLSELIGAGGMGEVYRAFDDELQRDVAIKVLPPEYLDDPERVDRFRREARAISSLNHPNIITIHEILEHNNLSCLVTEFIDGITLREKLKEPLPVPEILYITTQISEALASAHERGIVHRDLKPENIMLRRDGIVKILDFGLAKLGHQSSKSNRDQTEPGQAVGTIQYMSPEQALAKEVDHRTDIFSFGAILYEMVSGEQAFHGSSDAAIYDAILNHPPRSIEEERGKELPPGLERLIGRSLQKRAEDRYHSFAEILEEISQIDPHGESRPKSFYAQVAETFRSGRSYAILGSIVIVAALAVYWQLQALEYADTTGADISKRDFYQLTSGPDLELFPSLSPDGRLLAYASDKTGDWDIYLRTVGEPGEVNLTADSPADDRHPAFSPDGTRIAFRSEREGGGIFVVNIDGSDFRRGSREGHNPVWSPSGDEIAYSTAQVLNPSARGAFPSALRAVSLVTGETRLISEKDAVQPNWSPAGNWIAYWGLHRGGQRDIWIVSAQGGDPIQVTDDSAVDWNPVWSPDGAYLYFASDRKGRMNLWRTRIDSASGKPVGQVEPVTIPAASSWYVSFARDSQKMAFAEIINRTRFAAFSFSPHDMKITGEMRTISTGTGTATNPAFSPDGDFIIFDNLGDAQEDIFIANSDGSGLRRITNDLYKDRAPRWEPDGERILFFSDRGGKYDLWSILPDGSDVRQLTANAGEGPGSQAPLWSPDGRRILENRQWGPAGLLTLDPKSGQAEFLRSIPLPEEDPPNFMYWSWSSDGEKLAGWNSEGAGIYVYHLRDESLEKVYESGSRPLWLKDSRHLLFFGNKTLSLLDTATDEVETVFVLNEETFQSIAISQDNRTILASLSRLESDIWLAE